ASKSSRVVMGGRWSGGRKVGRSEGREVGRSEGRKDGRTEGRKDGKMGVRERRPDERSAVLPFDLPSFRPSVLQLRRRLLHDLLVTLRVPLRPRGGVADVLAEMEDELEDAEIGRAHV